MSDRTNMAPTHSWKLEMLVNSFKNRPTDPDPIIKMIIETFTEWLKMKNTSAFKKFAFLHSRHKKILSFTVQIKRILKTDAGTSGSATLAFWYDWRSCFSPLSPSGSPGLDNPLLFPREAPASPRDSALIGGGDNT